MTVGSLLGALSLMLIGAGMLFFLAGSIGVLRLPDLLSRLHALTKADNLGLGLVVLGLTLQADGHDQGPTRSLQEPRREDHSHRGG